MEEQLIMKTVWSMGMTLGVCFMLIHKKYRVELISLFTGLYILGQMLGYGAGIELLRAVIPAAGQAGTGVTYQFIPSTLIPLSAAVVVDFSHRRLSRSQEPDPLEKRTVTID